MVSQNSLVAFVRCLLQAILLDGPQPDATFLGFAVDEQIPRSAKDRISPVAKGSAAEQRTRPALPESDRDLQTQLVGILLH
jgi:hypothetical protein